MEQYFDVISKCPLFASLNRADLEAMLRCLGARTAAFSKGAPVFLEGDSADFVGVVISGAVQIVRDDYYGNRSVLAVAEPGELFGEVFSCAGLETMPVSAVAVQSSVVLCLDCRRVLTLCSNACQFHNRLVKNLLQVVAHKNLMLNNKIQVMSQKTTREKLLAFLSEQAKRHGKPAFVIPYDRQALADFLGVERSAMSAEIGKLRKAGILDSRGSWFSIYPGRVKDC